MQFPRSMSKVFSKDKCRNSDVRECGLKEDVMIRIEKALWWRHSPEPAAGRKARASGERELHNSVYREFRFHNEMTQL
ncbi:hypothetical protein EVAR_77331_1 [Eumeta japonica]|uniref:Uncharacterized protein n=1 Tax=Eumeta variegata TaxID=151549 RepID=A0A4C1UYE0_EUMVA|nr:hypothetical protein EVAR_77331_1 [Eumeta japonica]